MQMKTIDVSCYWNAIVHVPAALALVGGGVEGGVTVIVNGEGVSLAHCDASHPVTGRFYSEQIVLGVVSKQGEGEGMIFAVLRKVILLTLHHGCGAAAASSLPFKLVSIDTDAITRTIPEMQRVYDEFGRVGVEASALEVYSAVHPKKSAVLWKLGIIIESTGVETRGLLVRSSFEKFSTYKKLETSYIYIYFNHCDRERS